MTMKRLLADIPAAIIAILVLAVSSASCTDNDDYSSDPSHKVSFSTDTIAFDTVFTSVGSATECFVVHNSNDIGVTLQATLCGGNASPFRMNVDGQSGTVVPDIRIASDDSAYCFVSVNIDPHDSDSPVLAFDSIRFTNAGGTSQYVYLSAFGQDVVILRRHTFKSDTVLSSRRPFLVYDTLTVGEGASLTVEKGARLYFHDDGILHISGRILAEGTCDSTILMRGDRMDRMLNDMPYDLVSGRWGGIIIDSCSFGNRFVSCDIHGGTWGVRADTSSTDFEKLLLDGTTIHNVKGDALQLNNCSARIVNSQITNAGNHCVSILGGDNTFVYCTIANFYPWSQCGTALNLTNVNSKNIYPIRRADFRNSVITGYGQEGLSVVLADSVTSDDGISPENFSFRNSLILAKDTAGLGMKDCICENDTCQVYGADNFRSVLKVDFRFDFRLDSLSSARSLATPVPCIDYDIRGVARPCDASPDAGCFQFVAE